MGFTENSDFYREGFTKNQYRVGDCLKREGLGQFVNSRGGALEEREGGVFEGE